jgi:hypothetical protein
MPARWKKLERQTVNRGVEQLKKKKWRAGSEEIKK